MIGGVNGEVRAFYKPEMCRKIGNLKQKTHVGGLKGEIALRKSSGGVIVLV